MSSSPERDQYLSELAAKDARYGKKPVPIPTKPKRLSLAVLPCAYEGDVVENATCGCAAKHVRWCTNEESEADRCVRSGSNNPEIQSCDRCPLHSVRQLAEARPSDAPVGVVIGSYRWPELVELQLKVLRSTCGAVPVCVSTDRPEDVPALTAVCAADPDCYLWPNADRIGHTGGDLAAFWKGVVWGQSKGLKVVAKLSQRFIPIRSRWLQDGADDLLKSGLPLSTQACKGREVFPLRTEACLLDISRWNRPEVLSQLSPAKRWMASGTPMSAEHTLFDVLGKQLGGQFHRWGLFGEDRYKPSEWAVWHCSHRKAEYVALAEKFGVTLPDDFRTDGWLWERNRNEYLIG